jgi:hypothetical protein
MCSNVYTEWTVSFTPLFMDDRISYILIKIDGF